MRFAADSPPSLRCILRRSFQPNWKLRLTPLPFFPYEENPVIKPEMMSQPNVQELFGDRVHGLLPHQRLLPSLLRQHIELVELHVHNIPRQKALLRVLLLMFLVLHHTPPSFALASASSTACPASPTTSPRTSCKTATSCPVYSRTPARRTGICSACSSTASSRCCPAAD